jgi:hypothetical protein
VRDQKDRSRAGALPLPEGPPRILHGPAVERCLDAVRGSIRRVRLAEGLGLLVLLLAGGTVVLFAADNLLSFEAPARTALLVACGLAVLLVLLFAVLVRPFRPLGDEECALIYDERHPELEDRLINTVLFDRVYPPRSPRGDDRARLGGIEGAVADRVREETAAAVSDGPRRRIGSRRGAVRWGILALGALLALGAYRLLLPEHFANAAARFARPILFVAPLARTVLRVTPGHATLSPLEKLRVVAEASGRLPESAEIHLSFGAAPAMEFDGRAFVFDVGGQTGDFRYRVHAGDAWSEEFLVKVRKLPSVEAVDLVVHPPAYTGLPPETAAGGGSSRVLKGSAVEIRVRASKAIARGSLLIRDGEPIALRPLGPSALAVSWTADRDIAYDFRLEDEEGLESAAPEFGRAIAVFADAAPSADVLRPGRDASLPPGEGLPVAVRAEDDVGLASASIEAASPTPSDPDETGGIDAAGGADDAEPAKAGRKKGGADHLEWKEVLAFPDLRGLRAATPTGFLDLGALGVLSGGSILYRARAVDLKGQAACSRSYEVRVLAGSEALARTREALARARPGIDDVLRRERDLRARSAAARNGSAESEREACPALAREQEEIAAAGREVLAGWDGDLGADVRRALGRAVAGPMPRAARALDRGGAEGASAAPARLDEAIGEEDRAIALLEAALRRIDAALADLARGEMPKGEGAADRLRGESGKLREFLDRLEAFAAEEKRVLAETKTFLGKEPDDFTGAEKEKLEELAAAEEKWAKFFADAKDDLSKVSPQDMSGSSLSEEVVEIIEEIDLARDYLKSKDIELAVPKEQSGLGLAEKLETNIERWLSRARDNLKWNMEEATEEFDVPLADLPEELEDIVGDLIDQEELMTEETEDVTSSWLDSMDDGAGWDAMDGPISNMSAKGVTGNLQPNDMEIGGRSGEGRSGRSLGQFVEETASGKGGRPTPARSTADPFEGGEVKDSSREAGSGATGGGKLSGAGEEGLRGAPSPELRRRMGSLARQQARAREEAERLDHALRRRRYFSQDLDRAIDLMAKMEMDLEAGRPYRYGQRRREIETELRQTREVIGDSLDHQFEAPPPVPKDDREELLNSAGEEMPREYRDLIRDYYKGLAESAADGSR